MGRVDPASGLNRQACNTGRPEEAVSGKDHQIGGDAGTGGGIEAGDRKNSLHAVL